MENPNIAIVYFSKNRPFQLDLSISSNRNRCKDWDVADHYIIYKATDERYANAYDALKKEHPDCHFIEEDVFKNDLLSIMIVKTFVVFIVDDAIYTSDYSIEEATKMLWGVPSAVGFSLRLGENTTECFAMNIKNDMPKFINITNNIMVFNWAERLGKGDFGFPLEVSSTLYRVRDLLLVMSNSTWKNPNELEGILWANVRAYGYLPNMLCYKKSLSFCNPINKVYLENNNNRTGIKISYSPELLLEKYENGIRANPEKYYNFITNGCHEEVEFEYMEKK